MLVIAVGILLAQTSEREKIYEKEQREKAAIAAFTFPGFDASDSAVKSSAAYFCGKTESCQTSFLKARNDLIRAAVTEKKERGALKLLTANVNDGHVDWRWAYQMFQNKYHPPLPPEPTFRMTQCDSFQTKYGWSTRCYSY